MGKVLKVWQGVTSGSYAGRDDGYAETKYQVYDSMRDLARDYGKKRNEKHYKLEEVNSKELEELVKSSLVEQADKAKVEKKKSIENEIKKLQNDLNKLS